MSIKWNNTIPWNKDSSYILRCIDEAFGPSKSTGKPMITLKFEVVSPEEMEVAGEQVTIAGVSAGLTKYYSTKSISEDGTEDTDKSAKLKTNLVALYKAFGLPSDNINVDNPTLGFKGLVVYALLVNDATEQRKSPTKAQLAAGQKQGDILINPVTKQPLKQNYPAIADIYGLAPTDSTKPY